MKMNWKKRGPARFPAGKEDSSSDEDWTPAKVRQREKDAEALRSLKRSEFLSLRLHSTLFLPILAIFVFCILFIDSCHRKYILFKMFITFQSAKMILTSRQSATPRSTRTPLLGKVTSEPWPRNVPSPPPPLLRLVALRQLRHGGGHGRCI